MDEKIQQDITLQMSAHESDAVVRAQALHEAVTLLGYYLNSKAQISDTPAHNVFELAKKFEKYIRTGD